MNNNVDKMTPFIVMDVLERANELQSQVIDIIHLENNEESSFYPYWHTMKDNIEQIDPNTLGMVGDVVLNVIYRN